MQRILARAAVAAMLFGSASAFAQASPPNINIDELKREAASVTGELQDLIFPNGRESMLEASREFQETMGIEGIDSLSSPAGKKAGLADVRVSQHFDFACNSIDPARPYGAAALTFRVKSCQVSGGKVRSVDVSVCDNTAKAGTCVADRDFRYQVRLTDGAYSSLNDFELGLGCNSVGMCRVTAKGTYRFGGDNASLQADAQAMSSSADSEASLIGNLRKTLEEGNYANEILVQGEPLQECLQQNMANGTARSCDGGTVEAAFSAAPPPEQCNEERRCVRESVHTRTYRRSCVRTFPLTWQTTTYNTIRTLECTVEEPVNGGRTKNDKKSDTCQQQGLDENGKPFPDKRDGYELVLRTERQCVAWTVGSGESDICVRERYNEFLVSLAPPQVKSVEFFPTRPSGACDTNPLSESTIFDCEGNRWFGRTLPDAQCMALYVDEADGTSDTEVLLQLSYKEKPGCGVCLTPKVTHACYGSMHPTEAEIEAGADEPDGCENIDHNICRLVETQPESYTGDGGLVISQREVYECKQETRMCMEYSRSSNPACNAASDLAFGLDTINPGNIADGSLNNALVAAAIIDGTAKGLEGDQDDAAVPKIFGGKVQKCKRPVGGIGSLLQRNCCRTSLQRPKPGNIIRGGCSLDEAKLAAARRANYTHYVGEYCSKRMSFPRKCLERKKAFCVFAGLLPRLVQEQGRAQLASIVANSAGANIQQMNLSYGYYDEGDGSWTEPVIVNGVRVAAWRWPSYCANPATAQEKLLTDPFARDCPGVVTTWFASCDVATGCGPLPYEPDEGSEGWWLQATDPLQNVTTALNRYAVASGACSPHTQQCQYKISAWPIGVGGKAVVTRDLTWNLYSEVDMTPQEGMPTAEQYELNNIGDLMFRGYSLPQGGRGLPATVRVDFSRDGGQTWTSYQVPTVLREEMTFPGTDVRIRGECDATHNLCMYRVTGTTSVSAKPWRSAKDPDCSGFTAGQLSVLDFSKMDLSEWLATILDDVSNSGLSPAQAVQQAQQHFENFNRLFQGGQGTVTASAPVSANVARVVPAEGFGPFTARLAVTGVWPEFTGDPSRDTDKVTRVTVDWGDCSPAEELLPVDPSEGQGFRGAHRYLAPDDEIHRCLPGFNKNNPRNLNYKIKLTLYTTKSGVQTRYLTVENAWATFPGAAGNNDFVSDKVTVPANPDGTPLPPQIKR